jgi:Na+/melibiose symporter-like transporter
MFKTLTREITLAVQARNGLSPAVVVWLAIMGLALVAALIFLCVAAYDWLAARYGGVHAGVVLAGVFAVIAVIAAIASALIRRRVRERAILARAARAQAPSWLLDPKVLGVVVETGRSIGWQRVVPLAVLGFLAAQWSRERRDKGKQKF